jgi:hypothetical protein
MLSEEELRDAVLVVFANKQDLPKAMPVNKLTEELGLTALRSRTWHIQGCCATTGRLRVLPWRMMRFWHSASVAVHALLKRMSQNDEATIVFHEPGRVLHSDFCDMRNLSASLARP